MDETNRHRRCCASRDARSRPIASDRIENDSTKLRATWSERGRLVDSYLEKSDHRDCNTTRPWSGA